MSISPPCTPVLLPLLPLLPSLSLCFPLSAPLSYFRLRSMPSKESRASACARSNREMRRQTASSRFDGLCCNQPFEFDMSNGFVFFLSENSIRRPLDHPAFLHTVLLFVLPHGLHGFTRASCLASPSWTRRQHEACQARRNLRLLTRRSLFRRQLGMAPLLLA